MTALARVGGISIRDAVLAFAGGEHISNFTRKFVAGAVLVAFVGVVIFIWWLKSDREDD